MQDASIETTKQNIATDSKSGYLKSNFPEVLDTDDMVFELGRLQIVQLNHEKLLQKLFNKLDELTKAHSSAVEQLMPLKVSNESLAETNRKLDLVNSDLRKDIRVLEQVIEDKDIYIAKQGGEITNLLDQQQSFMLEIDEYAKSAKKTTPKVRAKPKTKTKAKPKKLKPTKKVDVDG